MLCVDVDPRHCAGVAERLRAAAAEPFTIDGRSVSITAAVGVGTSRPTDPAGGDLAALLRQADHRMYEQEAGKPRMRAAGGVPGRRRMTGSGLSGLLAVSGMRLGEVIRLDRPDLDTAEAVVNRRLVQERLLI